MAESKKCAHPSCSCTVPDGEKYCSLACKGAGDSPEIGCNCGHTSCEGYSLTE